VEPGHAVAMQIRVICGALTLLLLACCVAANPAFFFHDAHVEFADFAANSLRVTGAKTGLDLHGNSSRWGFYHPGPFFFYLFAVSEYLFYDLLGLTASPFAAQLLGSALFQCACVSVALVYALRRLDFLIALPFAVTLLVVHWHFAPGASTWPPYLLFGPVVLMIVFGAALADGDIRALPVLAFAAGVACHNHVAQPLIAAPLVGLSAAVWFCTGPAKSTNTKRALFATALIAVAFAAPLIADAMQGRESNIATILRHLASHVGERHSLGQGIGYLLSFALYERRQETVIGDRAFSLLTYILSNWRGLALLFLPVLGAAAAFMPFGRSQPYLRWLTVFTVLAMLLSAAWGVLQDGEMYEFNGNFNYAVLFAAYLLPLFALSKLDRRPLGKARTALAVGGWLSVVVCLDLFPKSVFAVVLDAPGFIAEIKEFAAGHRQAYVRYSGDAWVEALAAINQLDRAGVAFRVDNEHAYLHRSQAQRSHEDFAFLENRNTTVLDVVAATPEGVAIPRIREPGGLQFALAQPNLSHLPEGSVPLRDLEVRYVTRGFYFGATYAATGPLAQILFLTVPRVSDVMLALTAFPFDDGMRRLPQRVIVRFDGIALGEFALYREAELAVTVPQRLWSVPGRHCLTLLMPDAQFDVSVPADVKAPGVRRLGVALKGIVVH
jgi:hypothetical protein